MQLLPGSQFIANQRVVNSVGMLRQPELDADYG